MHRVTIQYAAPADAEGFDAHYRDVHVPLASRLPGLRRFTLTHPRPLGPGDAPYLVAELWFDDADAMKAALKSPEMGETGTDAEHMRGAFGIPAMTMFTGAVENALGG